MPSRASCMKSVTPRSASCLTCATLPMCATTGMFCFFASSTMASTTSGVESFVAHPELDEVDLQRLVRLHSLARFLGRCRLQRGRARVRAREVESLSCGVHARRQELARLRVVIHLHDFRLVVAGHADGRHAPVERDRQQLPHDICGLIQMAVHVDEAGNDGLARSIHHRRTLRHLHLRTRAGSGDPVAADEDRPNR